MSNIFFITFIVFLLFVVGLATSLFFGRKPLKGSCGGLGAIMGESCAFCEKKGKCRKAKQRES